MTREDAALLAQAPHSPMWQALMRWVDTTEARIRPGLEDPSSTRDLDQFYKGGLGMCKQMKELPSIAAKHLDAANRKKDLEGKNAL